MKKIGKISVTFFLNRNVKPEFPSPMFDRGERYPLYIQVTYDRKNTQFRSLYHKTFSNLEEAFFSTEDRDQRENEVALIKKVIEYEITNNNRPFQLKGLKDRYLNYTDSVFNAVDNYFRSRLYSALVKAETEFFEILDPWRQQQISYQIFYNASLILIPDFDNLLPPDFKEEIKIGLDFHIWLEAQENLIRLIDWLDTSAIKTVEAYLIKKKYNTTQVKKAISFIDHTIRLSLSMELK